MHVWRDNAVDLFEAWVLDYKAKDAYDNGVHKVAPRPISGRWARKSACEEFLLGMNVANATKIFVKVVAGRKYYEAGADDENHEAAVQAALPAAGPAGAAFGKAKAKAKAKAKGKGRGRKRKRGLDDTAAEERETHAAQLGKWARHAVKEFCNPVFWLALRVSNMLSKFLDPLLWTLEKYAAHKRNDDRDAGAPSNLSVLIFGPWLVVGAAFLFSNVS